MAFTFLKLGCMNKFRKSLTVFFVCATLISVKSKYAATRLRYFKARISRLTVYRIAIYR
ncbi:hypothetical protein OOU_Y34scaffold01091g2 [Pyricularia oryzae Y34]|uniref:Uncharacterized protein n=2 Tax=Pyricularia oryzae TaxID=318829 RepID=A0AA97NLX6_PYRO3|nr:hypothetical protein OOU_Y34scaffold01091g2 [Pyricularia oryzae Y34]